MVTKDLVPISNQNLNSSVPPNVLLFSQTYLCICVSVPRNPGSDVDIKVIEMHAVSAHISAQV